MSDSYMLEMFVHVHTNALITNRNFALKSISLSLNLFFIIGFYLQDIGVLIFENERSKTIVVTKQGHDDVKKFWKRQKRS